MLIKTKRLLMNEKSCEILQIEDLTFYLIMLGDWKQVNPAKEGKKQDWILSKPSQMELGKVITSLIKRKKHISLK
jgi:hypothetical protein